MYEVVAAAAAQQQQQRSNFSRSARESLNASKRHDIRNSNGNAVKPISTTTKTTTTATTKTPQLPARPVRWRVVIPLHRASNAARLAAVVGGGERLWCASAAAAAVLPPHYSAHHLLHCSNRSTHAQPEQIVTISQRISQPLSRAAATAESRRL